MLVGLGNILELGRLALVLPVPEASCTGAVRNTPSKVINPSVCNWPPP